MLTLVLVAELQSGSRMYSGDPKNVGQTVVSKYSVALCAVAVETDDSTGLALRVAPVRAGGRLEPAVPGFWV